VSSRAEIRSEETASEVNQLLLSVVVPVYNEGSQIVDNVRTIVERIGQGLNEPFELVIVSDGSFDRTYEHLLEEKSETVRVIHYDRNLGKGYAVKVGALAAKGQWISFVDADLDLDPAAIPRFVDIARAENLDFAIGSKRHPESIVHYPRSRRLASRLYQQLARLLFGLNVQDTQTGLKVFRREVAEEVVPLLLVKQFAFDLELLAVANSLGFGRIRELPIVLDYRFTGSGVRSMAVLNALIDTAAIFYRLRILGYYRKKRALIGGAALGRAVEYQPLVSIVASDPDAVSEVDYPMVEVIRARDDTLAARIEAAGSASGELLAFLAQGHRPAGNWLSATIPYFGGSPYVAAVTMAAMAPANEPPRTRAAAAIWESRLGGGALHYRFMPGNIRIVRDFPATNMLIRRSDFEKAAGDFDKDERIFARLADLGRMTLYTPETFVVRSVPGLFRPHLRRVAEYGRARGRSVRARGRDALRVSTALPLLIAAGIALAIPALLAGGVWAWVWLLTLAAYVGAVFVAAALAALRLRSIRIGALAALGIPLTHLTYAVASVRGYFER
jgi:glycosyltransferase involved in cell wall biosynthesis